MVALAGKVVGTCQRQQYILDLFALLFSKHGRDLKALLKTVTLLEAACDNCRNSEADQVWTI